MKAMVKLSLIALITAAVSTTHALVPIQPPLSKSIIGRFNTCVKAVVVETDEATTDEKTTSATVEDITQSSVQSSSATIPPGQAENSKFRCDESVYFWRGFESQGTQSNLDRIRELLARNAPSTTSSSNAMRAAYWSSQVLRTSYFIATAALGSIGSDLHERFIANRAAAEAARNAGESFMDINGGDMTTNLLSSDVPSRLIFEALKCYEQDWKYVESGLLNFPWDGIATASRDGNQVRLQLDHKQANPLFALSEAGRVVRESIGIFSRRNKFGGQPSGQVWMDQPSSTDTTRYPNYYMNDFHYQTDGWLSSESANTYEASTETLFIGRQDAMQRQTLIPLLKHFQSTQPKNILEVACGTGRFATFVRDNFPQADMVLTDLSPFYLEKARENDEYWRTYRGEKALQEKKSSSSKSDDTPKPASFVQANAESLPFPDESFDAVTCVYLFHELPAEAQDNAAREMARVLKPGGIVVFSDSIQLGDRPALDMSMGNFGRLNEPHYGGENVDARRLTEYSNQFMSVTSPCLFCCATDFMQRPLAPLFERHGLKCDEKYVSSSTKTLSFTKPVKSTE